MGKITAFALLCATLSLGGLAKTQVQPRDIAEHITLPNQTIKLPNGLTAILSPDAATKYVAVSIWYDVGAKNEKPGLTGFAHLFEHLMFEGSRHVKNGDHFKLLEKVGAFDLNASTSFDRTNYYQTVPKHQLELTLALEASRMFWLDIDQARLDEQRAVVRREREQRLEVTPYGNASHSLWQKLFDRSHPYHGQVIGSHADLERASVKDVQGFYDRFYVPSNATITLVGDFDQVSALALIQKYFGTLPMGEKLKDPELPKVVLNNEEIIRAEEKIGKLPLLHYQYVTPSLFQPGDAEMDVLAHILAGGENGRLTKALTRDKHLASSVSAYQQSFGDLSVFTIDALLNPGANEEEARAEIDKVLASLKGPQPIEENEIDRARNSILTQQLFGLQSLGGYSGRAEILQTYNQFARKTDYLKEDILRYRKLDRAALEKAAQTYLGQGRKILIANPIQASVAKKGN